MHADACSRRTGACTRHNARSVRNSAARARNGHRFKGSASGRPVSGASGGKTDGTRFLSEALSRGACALLLPPGVPLPAGNYSAFESQDPLQTLLRAAAFRRSFSAARVIAVSGSSGKTSIKDALFALLSEKETVQKSKGNHNSLLGMPLSLLSMEEADDFVLELGVNHPGEMERLSRALSPDICVLTNIGTAHVGMFESPAALALEKAKIVCGLRPGGVLFCPEDLPKALFTGEKSSDSVRGKAQTAAFCRITRIKTE